MSDSNIDAAEDRIAIVGFAGRFPDAPNTDVFWENLRNGVESIHEFSEAELSALGIPEAVYKDPNFVPRATRLPDFDRFDAGFFGFTPREAAVMDPQARIFLETTKAALDHAGYDPARHEEPVSLFAGSNPNDYWFLLGMGDLSDPAGAWDRLIGNDKDFLATRVSHRLDLRGPAMTLQTACSTSLVAVHLACQSLLAYESTIALAGGVSVNLRQRGGYMYQPGMILSPDGHCRAFDADAGGTVLGQGAGVVVLKRLEDAVADGDTIHAVILATAINNDGSNKISYTAPNEDGQAEVIATAHRLAGIDPATISYIEAHGTGTSLGDPVEIAALTRAFAAQTDRTGFCAIGSVKTNVGHTDAAAGVTGLIKTVLALKHRELPPSLNFAAPNPNIDFDSSPFFVNTELRSWESEGPRRAGVSSFGVGGTNAHAIVEEAPAAPDPVSEDGPQLLVLSARSESALATQAAELAHSLDGDRHLADAAFTLQLGRGEYEHRTYVVAESAAAGAEQLRTGRLPTASPTEGATDLVFMYSGQGAQYPGMMRGLYEAEPVFRDEVDRCAVILQPIIDADIRRFLFPAEGEDESAAEALRQTSLTQPALFTVEWSLTRLLDSWGIVPAAVVGHSIGEYVAATVAGVFTLESGLRLVARRGALMQSLPEGAMLAVQAAGDELIPQLSDGVELAAHNSSRLSVVTGDVAAIEAFASRLEADDIGVQRLHTSHAFHSHMMEPILDEFAEEVRRADPQPPQLTMLSNVTGGYLTAEDATTPEFWAGQIRRPVLFSDNVSALAQAGRWAFLEVGPGRALATFVRQHETVDADTTIVTGTRHPREDRSDRVVLLEAVGGLWQAGITPDWQSLHEPGRRRLPLPTYPFERERYWAPAVEHVAALGSELDQPAGRPITREPLDNWSYLPSWNRLGPAVADPENGTYLIFATGEALTQSVVDGLGGPEKVTVVIAGSGFKRISERRFEIDPTSDVDYSELFETLATGGNLPDAIVHLWHTQEGATPDHDISDALDSGVNSVLAIARELGRHGATVPRRFYIVTRSAHQVLGHEAVRPASAALLGPTKVIPLEYSNLAVQLIDIDRADEHETALLNGELRARPDRELVALRGGHRWGFSVEPVPLPTPRPEAVPLKRGGVYLVVGGLGGVGLSIARHLAVQYNACLVLVGRSGRPDPATAPEDEELGRRAAVLAEIEVAARAVRILQADATSESQMRRVVEQAEAEVGPIDGVVFTAAVLDDAGAIHSRTREEMHRVTAAKIEGTIVIDRVFAGRQLDFILLSSSIATVLYHNRFGQVGYVTANTFVESYPAAAVGPTRMVVAAWDDWLEYGLSVRATQVFAERYGYEDISIMSELNSFSPQEGGQLFERLLAGSDQIYFVSPTNLVTRIEHDKTVSSPFLDRALADETSIAGTKPLDDDDVPGLIRNVWCDLLGLQSVEDSDDFFVLGGDSLQVARLADRLSRRLGTEIPINLVFEAPTLEDLTAHVSRLVDADRDDVVEGVL